MAIGRRVLLTGLVTEFTYTGDHLSSITDPADRTTTFEHDGAGNLIRAVFPDGSTRSFGYGGRHLMTSETDGNLNSTFRQYDTAGKITGATHADGSVRENVAADLTGLVDPASGEGTEANPAPVVRPSDGLSTYTVGPFDEDEDQIPEERAWTIEPGPMGLPASIVAPDGLETTYERDADGNVERVQFLSLSFSAGAVLGVACSLVLGELFLLLRIWVRIWFFAAQSELQ